MKVWWLLGILVLLLLLTIRERFDATNSIRGPPYDDAGKIGIYNVANSANQRVLREQATALVTIPTTDPMYEEKLKAAAGGILAPVVGEFFTNVFKPATTPITDANVASFMETRTSPMKSIEEQVLKAYFVGQQGIGTSMQGGENSYASRLASLGQNVGYLTNSSGERTTTSGTTSTSTNGTTTTTTPASQSSTGGSSTSSWGPNSGGSSKRSQPIFGPTFNGVGDGGNFDGDSTKNNSYPDLLGGGDRHKGARREGGRLDGGTLVNGGSSRQPGDMDLIPDPYRVGQQFSSASYSFKTDPAPYLADFSAFLR